LCDLSDILVLLIMRLTQLLLFVIWMSNTYAQTPYFDDGTIDPGTLIVQDEMPALFAPPIGPVRSMAEWEEIQSLAVSWQWQYKAELSKIIDAAKSECNVRVLCASQSDINSVKNHLNNAGVDWSQNVTFLVISTTTVWIRDYGPNTVYANGVDSLILVDWIYNRNRPADDNSPVKLAQAMSLPVFKTNLPPYDLVNTGGNFMTDGLGTGFCSKLVLRNNNQINDPECSFLNDDVFGTSDHAEIGVDSIMSRYMGIDRYIKMDELPYDCIHHIDMHMKLLDEETLLVGQYPSGVSDGPTIESNLAYIQDNFNSAFGTPYQVARIVMPPSASGKYPSDSSYYYTYTNAVFVNKTILVPTYNLSSDGAALEQWRVLMPGYKIVGINSNEPIKLDGALHCITHEIGVPDPLLIVHQRIRQDMVNPDGTWPAKARVSHRSGIASATLWYALDSTQAWQAIPMSALGGDDYEAIIPKQTSGTVVHYYIEAEAVSGKKISRPLPAPAAHWTFKVNDNVSTTAVPGIVLGEIFPNPTTGLTNLSVYTNQSAKGRVTLSNALGQHVVTLFEGSIPSGASTYKLVLPALPAGAYMVQVQSGQQFASKRLILR
jgi:agmatine deiminase